MPNLVWLLKLMFASCKYEQHFFSAFWKCYKFIELDQADSILVSFEVSLSLGLSLSLCMCVCVCVSVFMYLLIGYCRRAEIVPLTPRGAEFFGLSHPTIQNLIQSCPGAKKCSNYKWQRFEVSRLPASEVNVHEVDEPTVNVDALYAMPAFANLRTTTQSQSSLRTLLTTSPASSWYRIVADGTQE